MSAINLNTATIDELESIHKIGPVKAAAIVNLQQKGMVTMEQLVIVTGLPAAYFSDLVTEGVLCDLPPNTPQDVPQEIGKPQSDEAHPPRTVW